MHETDEQREKTRRQMDQELRESYQSQAIFNELLRLSLQELSLDELLAAFLDTIIRFPWFGLKTAGAVFLKNSAGDSLRLAVSRGLPESLKKSCGSLPLGRCLCGRAAATKKVLFADQVDQRHENSYAGITPHGHYCVPILSSDNELLGVFNLYIPAGAERRPAVETALVSAAQVAAALISRKRLEDRLKAQAAEALGLNAASEQLIGARTDEKELAWIICRVTQEIFSAIRMAWLGLVGPGKEVVRPLAVYGDHYGYLEEITVRSDDSAPGSLPSPAAATTRRLKISIARRSISSRAVRAAKSGSSASGLPSLISVAAIFFTLVSASFEYPTPAMPVRS